MTEDQLLMPKMGESITEGTILNWLVAEGEAFEEGDILLEVATDKVDNEVPAPASGILKKHLFEPKSVVAVGVAIATYEVVEGTIVKKTPKKEAVATKSTEASTKKTTKKTSQKPVITTNHNTAFTVPDGTMFVSPLIKSIAQQHHVSYEELARVPGTGKEGRLRKSDLMQYIEDGRPFQFAQPVAQADPTAYRIPQLDLDKGTGKIVEMDRMRQMIADHMVYSKHTSPHVTAYVEADLTELVHWRNANKVAFQEKHGQKLTFTPLFVEAVAKAVKDFPMINVSVDGANIIVKEHINIGMATALPSGNLIVPVVKDADKKNLVEIASEVNRLSALARENKLRGDDVKGSTFTISNVGTFGSVMGTPIINQPEAAILATGIIKKRAEVMERPEGDTIEIRQMMYLSLSFDHRIVDGFLGGSFLKRIADNLEQFDTKRKI
ncbi:dihydrolipoamide acetyltransferase component of pyruvate dehydrogenase complex [Dokdonia pacifica]|uniref:Dihydrolipoamide acetyltransferase component of pyruvate dehydrogenase complex n=1 Tax=Dokdonia pacifica TaxID=1627892 RepID=A0A238VP77_9FLAO|nr:dihydrolipoamide acetyltransferase family protein [Dokdonia pacifica]GGG19372.1 dihydrolipoamide acetyltransferase component of pyruvate dehydrogenase complex [Dokdonia pacifica]SNR36028.1 2-oxoglutarate dehydrogenase E2 component (dihydrolipoamide succinyltransferase) [Dokdonia pacifica]